jgi:hypothetical protein
MYEKILIAEGLTAPVARGTEKFVPPKPAGSKMNRTRLSCLPQRDPGHRGPALPNPRRFPRGRKLTRIHRGLERERCLVVASKFFWPPGIHETCISTCTEFFHTFLPTGGRVAPAADRAVQSDYIHDPENELIDELVQIFGMVVKAGTGGHDLSPPMS